jgi:hypothetical protein
MKYAVAALAIATLVTAVVGAVYWFKSSKVTAVPAWAQMGLSEPGDAEASQMGWLAAMLEASIKSAALNKPAAVWTGAAALLGAATTLASLFV